MKTEEKAKAYDEAIERAKDMLSYKEVRREDMEYLFPELAESEDERVRKAIMALIEWSKSYSASGITNDDAKKMFAWLEKQSTPQVRTGLEWVNTIDDACDKRYAEEYAHGEYCHEQSFKWGFQEGVDWLEKQGESTDINPSEFDIRLNKLLKQFETLPKEELASSLSFYLNVVQNDGTYKADEKQGVQKPANKVEPKFKVGDWIVDNCGYVWKIEGILNQFYILKDIEGGESRPTIEWTDNTFHLWTIRDAKDGDVLADEDNNIGIFQECEDIYWNSYIYLGCDGELRGFSIGGKHEQTNTHPATKEQRDILMKAMANAGYTFDFEKKELKKIELTKSESEEELSDFEAALFSAFSDGWQQYLHGEEVDFAQWAKEHSAELLEAANQNHVAWSEEDEDIRDTIIRDLKRLGGDMVTVKPAYKEEVDWLKSLKQRIGE